jgi:hypothetical protein
MNMILKDTWVKLTEQIEGLDETHVFYVIGMDDEKQECVIITYVPNSGSVKVVSVQSLRPADQSEAANGQRLEKVWNAWQTIRRAINEYREGDIVSCENSNHCIEFVVQTSGSGIQTGSLDWYNFDQVHLISRVEDTFSPYRFRQ